jgi:N-acetylmuramic acid 6-phosphate etherase
MVDLRATNTKLRQRAARIVSEVCAIDLDAARALLVGCDHEVKTALVVHLRGCSPEVARERLRSAGGVVRRALVDGSADGPAPTVA